MDEVTFVIRLLSDNWGDASSSDGNGKNDVVPGNYNWDVAESFSDINRNGVFDEGVDIFSPEDDFDGDSLVTVICDDEEVEFELSMDGDTILDAAMDEDLDVPFSCKGGVCCVCKAKVIEGKGNFGYDAKSEKFVDLLKEGIIDPKKVTRIALENAASIASMMLTTECVISDEPEDEAPMPPMGGGMPGGMPGMM